MKLHEQISKYLKDNKISVYQLADTLCVSSSHLYKLLRGERPIMRSILDKINADLDTTFEPDKEESKENDLHTPLI